MVTVSERGYFHWIDWLVFVLMLFVSAAAGLWHFRRAQKSNTQDYLLGGRSLGLFPVSASLVASFISGVTILGTPAEIYNFGTQYWITIISIFFSGVVVAVVYLPVFTNLQLNSVYEYLEIRFDRSVRILISLIFVFDAVLYQSIVIYVPALALNQVSGINIHLIGSVVCVVCVFYTVLGGIRAVVWTDALQVGVMIAAAISVAAIGTYQLGGMSEIWNKAVDAGRIEFLNFDPSPYTRHTVWTVLIGSWLYSTAYIAVNQTMVQRYKSLESTRQSQISIAIFTISVMVFISICCWCGLVLLAWWSSPKCDPRVSGLITADDQLLPAYVMEIAGHLHGIPGLFISGVFGAALSSLSVGFNSTSVVILEDFVIGCFKMKPSDRCSRIFVKVLVLFFGLLALSFLFLIEKLGGVLAVTNSLAAIAAGTSFGVFTLGVLFPWANSKGAFIGAVAGFVMAGWASFGANAAIGSGLVVPKKLPVPPCDGDINHDFLKQFEYSSEDDVFPLYRLSYHWVAPLGTLVVLVIGGLVTWITGARDPSSIDRNLLSPVIHRWLPPQKYPNDVNGLCMTNNAD
ncbi:sodium-coupled monocarboxylate transporter 1 [Nylanderia fulva]|uniref:sodium-coupled monocarboxylate transporter 1 n=1 Tax=Nylanderia fulva TaxID=613905 RepID=UPI0010FBAB35|nr:sodium-coupled monocarboxylate transporter 1 [Nylanderia fulva]XP_029174909.1 sodium-coupled monocarboxylate transporter 1 [Nylanderia fulva]XP_029174910.1 sodium-coupled monocarboxylate transporter 1 [Nylanderia fulva]XP_029174912.1 sodium-coupled monocarboxylate transporter 1 [Nylanderia fulva]